jgi:hypothetical protein
MCDGTFSLGKEKKIQKIDMRKNRLTANFHLS